MTFPWRFPACAVAIALVPSCAPRAPVDRGLLSEETVRRSGASLRVEGGPRTTRLPPGVDLGALSEDAAVAVALWNSPTFQSDLASLGLARADLIEAGMIRNPLLTLLFPLGPKQLELTAALPLEALWQRPRRVAAAQLAMKSVGERLVASALDLVRDTKYAFADAVFSRARERLAGEALTLRRRLAEIASGRLRAGDISRAESALVRVDAELGAADESRRRHERASADERLRVVLGLGDDAGPLRPADTAPEQRAVMPLERLVRDALALRPDVRAAELGLEAAAVRAGWERSKALGQVAAVADGNGAGKSGFELGPGLQIELPLFNRNEGGVARAGAEIERAAWQLIAARQRVGFEVRSAHRLYAEAREALDALRARVLPLVSDALAGAERAFAEGEATHLFVLESSRQLVDARLREVELEAALRRAGADLDRSVGRKLVAR